MLKEDMSYPVWRIARRFHRATRKYRGLPDFLIIGAHKGGTTSLFRYLCQHPDILPPKEKEIRYFTRCYDRGIDWYRSFFPTEVRLRSGRRRRMTFEASTDYLWDPHAPERIARDLPDAKFIVLLRDPVARAYSHYKMKVRDGHEDRSFSAALEDQDRVNELIERRGQDPAFFSDDAFHFSYLSRGLYENQLSNWHAHLSPRKFLVLCSEELFASPNDAFNEVLEFLDLRPWSVEFDTHNATKSSPLGHDAASWLRDYFRPHNQRLFDYLDRSFPWD